MILFEFDLIIDLYCFGYLSEITRQNLPSYFSTFTGDMFNDTNHMVKFIVGQMGNFVHTAFKAYCGVLLGPV